jgi:hypothetical protein
MPISRVMVAGDLVGARLEAFLDFLQQLGTARRRRCRPGVEGLACGGDCRLCIRRVASWDGCQQRTVGRRMHLDKAAADRRLPCAVDVELVLADHVFCFL